ncbi:MAG: hypothetical protein EOP11_04465 [Proteobacteria bacterium]|nr:MAG: hypothetical protein EOP11_04465 [Pseudomonadota bacterium]
MPMLLTSHPFAHTPLPMRFRVQPTQDGLTVFDSEAGECFKSRHSANLEIEEVFYRPGYLENEWRLKAKPFRILELGFGLGTNFLHLLGKTEETIELVSVERDLAGANFYLEQDPHPALRQILAEKTFAEKNYRARIELGDFFTVLPALRARQEKFHAVYFDPFSPKANPEAWSLELFSLAFDLLEEDGRLVTYSVSRVAKDAAAAAGFHVTKRDLPAALQKRNALLAVKPPRP